MCKDSLCELEPKLHLKETEHLIIIYSPENRKIYSTILLFLDIHICQIFHYYIICHHHTERATTFDKELISLIYKGSLQLSRKNITMYQ